MDGKLRSHGKLLRKLLLICALMFAFSFALVPLYSVFCKLTGFNGKTASVPAVAAASVDPNRQVQVEFLAQVDQAMPWRFTAEVERLSLQPGEVKVVNFRVENLSDELIEGQAIPSVSPAKAAQYFKKMECFCFMRQPLQARESKLMRLQFYIDPKLPQELSTVTLSYTMYRFKGS